MEIHLLQTREELGQCAAEDVAARLRAVVGKQRYARIVAATGASQFDFLAAIVNQPGIDWQKVTMFHLDEYIGLPREHRASFRRYLNERFISKVHLGRVELIDGEADAETECDRLSRLIAAAPVDLAFVGIGENGHLAFNDPPADFEIDDPYIVVALDEACRQQQVNEGWFRSTDEVPARAISMSIRQIMHAKHIFCLVPEQRKARAVKECLEGAVSPLHPASILQRHPDVHIYLDRGSASLLTCQRA